MPGAGKGPARGRKAAARGLSGDRRADAGPDEVTCLLCGHAYRAVGVTHLRARHGFEGPHPVVDYKVEFGLRVAACRDVCRTLAGHRIARAERDGRHWTHERIRKELRRRVRAGESVAPKMLGVAFCLAIRRLFRSWDRARRRAGLDPDKHRLTRRWRGSRIEQEIRRRHASGKALYGKIVEAEQPSLHSAAIKRRGSWGAALRSAGFDPAIHRMPRKWSVQKAREWVRAREARGLPITAGHVPTGLHGRVCRATPGGWTAFLESLGIRYPGVKKRRWTDADVLAEVRRMKRRGRPLNARAVRDAGGEALVQQARKRFGSWDQALRAAGFDPARMRLARRWSRESVFEAIRRWHAAGRSLERRLVHRQDDGLLQAAESRFEGGWPEAVAAALARRR